MRQYFKNDRPILDTIGSTTVVIEPYPTISDRLDHRAFKRSTTPGCEDLFEWCHVKDWGENGERARFYALHPGVKIKALDMLKEHETFIDDHIQIIHVGA